MNFNSNNEKLIFYDLPTKLFSLIPFFLITGPFLSDISISLISFLFLVYCIKKKDFSYFKNKYFYFFLFFWGYLMLNTIIKDFNFDSYKISFFYFRYSIFVIAIFAFLNFDSKFAKYFFYCILICFISLIFDGFYQYFFGKNILGWENSSRTASFFGDERILGSYLSRLWPILFGLSILILKKKNYLFSFLVLIFILSETLIFLSGDRSAFFYINLSAIFIIIFSHKLLKLRLFTLLMSIILIIIVSYINPTAYKRVFNKTIEQMNLKSKNNDDQIYLFSKAHTEYYISAYMIFLDNKILGVGVKNFRNTCKNPKYFVKNKKVCNNHPHNTYLQILAETGLIGFFFLLIILFNFCKHMFIHLKFRLKKKEYFNDFEICILSGIVICLWPFIPTGNVFNNWLNIITILNLPFLIWSISLRKT